MEKANKKNNQRKFNDFIKVINFAQRLSTYNIF